VKRLEAQEIAAVIDRLAALSASARNFTWITNAPLLEFAGGE